MSYISTLELLRKALGSGGYLGRSYLLLAVISSLAHCYFIPIAFECDALTYLNNAKAYVGLPAPLDDYRPPTYSIFLLLSGTVFPGSMLLTLVLQWALGLASALVFRNTLNLYCSPLITNLGAFSLIVSGIPFYAAKFILAEQLFLFFSITSIYLFLSYLRRGRIFDFRLSLLFSLLSVATRWDGLLITLAIIFFVNIFRRDGETRKTTIVFILISIFIYFGYSGVRVLYKRDMSIFGTIQNGTDRQLFWRLYTLRPLSSERAKEGGGTHRSFVNLTNGPNTKLLSAIVSEYLTTHPEAIAQQRAPLDQIKPAKTGDANSNDSSSFYNQLYGRFNEDPDLIVKNMFDVVLTESSDYYSFLIIQAVVSTRGVVQGEKLLRDVNIETLLSSKDIILTVLKDSNSYLGSDLVSVFYRDDIPFKIESIFPFWGAYLNIATEFNLAGCAKNGMGTRMWSEYVSERNGYAKIPRISLERFQSAASFGRNSIRAVFGTLFLIGAILWWRRSARGGVAFILYGLTFGYLVFYGVIAGGAYQRYEIITIPLVILSVCYTYANLANARPRNVNL